MEKITVTLIPENGSFQGKRTVIVSQPITLGRLMENQEQQTTNFLRFNSKVVSRQHARLLQQDGKFYIQDTKSSSGTFLNGERLSQQGTESRLFDLHDGDVIKLGEDYNQNGVVHLCVLMRIRLPTNGEEGALQPAADEDGYVDLTTDSDVKANVDDEFNTIWNSLVADLNHPLQKLRAANAAAAAANQQKAPSISASPQSTVSSVPQQQRNDNTVTLIKTHTPGTASTLVDSPSNTIEKMMADPNSAMNAAAKSPVDAQTAADCAALIETLQWESPELKDALIELAKKQDQQLIAFYRSLKGFPSSFSNVAAKYAKYSKAKK